MINPTIQPASADHGRVERCLRAAIVALVAACLAPLSAAAAPAPIDIRTGKHPGYWRIAIEWTVPAPADVRIQPGEVHIGPVTTTMDTDRLQRRLSAALGRVEQTGDTLILTLQPGIGAERLVGIRSTVLAVDFRRGVVTKPPPVAHAPPQRRPEPSLAAIEDSRVATPADPSDAATLPGPAMDPATDAPPSEPAATAPADAPPLGDRRALERVLPPLPPPTPATVPAHASAPPPVSSRPAMTVVISPTTAAKQEAETPARDFAAMSPSAADHAGVLPTPAAPPPIESGIEHAPEQNVEQSDEQAPLQDATTVHVTTDGDAWTFTFADTVPAAAWRRGDHVWLVFAEDGLTTRVEGNLPTRLEPVPHRDASVWRLRVPTSVPLRLDREGTAWTLQPGEPSPAPAAAAETPTTTLLIDDPWLGTTFEIAATATTGVRAGTPTRQGARVGLPTLQGFVVHDLTGAEPWRAGRGRDDLPPTPELGGLFDLAGETLTPAEARALRRELETALFLDPGDARRLALARLLLGEASPYEALAVLAAGERTTDPQVAARMEALGGAAGLLAGRTVEAAKLLPSPAETEDPEAALWQAMLAAETSDWNEAGRHFAEAGQVWRTYPMPLRREIAARAVEGALQIGAPDVALAVLDHIDQIDQIDASGPTTGRLALLEARALRASGQTSEAQRQLDLLGQAPTEPEVQRRARLLSVTWQLELRTLDGRAALDLLEADADRWLGDPEGQVFWAQLADLRAAAGDALGAFEALGRTVPGTVPRPTPAQLALLQAAADGEPPFEAALEDAVRLADAHAPSVPAGVERATLFAKLALRVTGETRALHVADQLYGRALSEAIPAELDLELRLALAKLRLERRLPTAALAALVTLEETDDPAVPALRDAARAMLTGAPDDAKSAPIDAPPAHAREVRATLDAVDRALEDARTLLDGGS